MRLIWKLLWTAAAGFFLAGAVVFPLVEPYYFARVAFSLGLWAVLYGVDSVLHFGLVSTSGLLSGGTNVHNVRVYGFLLWIGLFGYSSWRERRKAQAEFDQWAHAEAEAPQDDEDV